LNFTYEFSDKFKIIAGSFATHLGYELVDAVDNKTTVCRMRLPMDLSSIQGLKLSTLLVNLV